MRARIYLQLTCGPLTKNIEKIKKVKEKGDSRNMYKNE